MRFPNLNVLRPTILPLKNTEEILPPAQIKAPSASLCLGGPYNRSYPHPHPNNYPTQEHICCNHIYTCRGVIGAKCGLGLHFVDFLFGVSPYFPAAKPILRAQAELARSKSESKSTKRTVANHTNHKLIRSSSLQSRLNLDPVNAFEDMSDSELDNYLGKLHDYAVELKVSNQANQERASSHYCEVPPSHLFQKESRALAAQRFSNKKWGRGRPPPGRQQIERRNNRYRSKTTQPVRR